MRELGGDVLRFIIRKYLDPTDLSKNNNRLSIPVKQVKIEPDSLRGDEKEKVKERDERCPTRINKGMEVRS
ncbi:B3 domain-containing protein [Trema orientale]|uniref:B3 domain-containing protein n=1 Tax=Trema orientale TaxID=63057 RepID=A0A2P5FIP2_TREOI|nr:B3 domain-containing protein [Trema orientale]